MGWNPGSRLGPTDTTQNVARKGLLCPIEVNEQTLGSRNRPGLGYYGPPCVNYSINPGQGVKSVYIRTVFDKPETVMQRSGLGLKKSLVRRDDPQLVLKYRQKPEREKSEASTSNLQFIPLNRTVILNPHGIVSKEGISFVSGGFLNPSSK
ncbi:unnamed protein product [Echinostoma caproni]|uniref:G-patch domain-containing protein n=1 Tax=Echinostoma caproni TaxID=27848 RepID=A0A183B350_9TREM|nr:unnamed protein product [Echinostoma caproni]